MYVKHYTTHRFDEALHHADAAIAIRRALLPPGHMLVFHAMRVRALILEELALFERVHERDELLDEAQQIHEDGLHVAEAVFGARSVAAAKYWGNLGRLYQARKEYHRVCCEDEHVLD